MENEILFKNNLISIEWNDIRLELHDSDGRYLDYFFNYDDWENPDERASEYVKELSVLNEYELAAWCYETFDILKVLPGCDENELSQLREQWGDEWVCRIGSHAIVLDER